MEVAQKRLKKANLAVEAVEAKIVIMARLQMGKKAKPRLRWRPK